MAKKQANDTSTAILDVAPAPVEVSRGSTVCVVKMAHITGSDGESIPHDYSVTIYDSDLKLAPLELEGGATAVPAGLLADHIEAGSPGWRHLDSLGEVRVYESVAAAFAALHTAELRKVIAVTRHGAVLREWEQIEQAGESRRIILAEIRERLRLWADHKPAVHLPPPSIAKRPKPMAAEARA